jgi:hypothetical protein
MPSEIYIKGLQLLISIHNLSFNKTIVYSVCSKTKDKLKIEFDRSNKFLVTWLLVTIHFLNRREQIATVSENATIRTQYCIAETVRSK